MTAGAAAFGLTRKIRTTVNYRATQVWAAAFAAAHFGAIRYQPRFSTAAAVFAFAFFGPAGGRDGPVDPVPLAARTVADTAGIVVETVPYLRALRVESAPSAGQRRDAGPGLTHR